jgi:hypothetical protein
MTATSQDISAEIDTMREASVRMFDAAAKILAENSALKAENASLRTKLAEADTALLATKAGCAAQVIAMLGVQPKPPDPAKAPPQKPAEPTEAKTEPGTKPQTWPDFYAAFRANIRNGTAELTKEQWERIKEDGHTAAKIAGELWRKMKAAK